MLEQVDLVSDLLKTLEINEKKKAIITGGDEITYSELYENAIKYAGF